MSTPEVLSVPEGAAARGVRWVGAARVGAQVLGLAVTVVLARLLSPEAYGLYAMAYVAVQLATYVEGLRLEPALVQAERLGADALASAAAGFLGLGAVAAGALWAAAPLVAGFFAAPEVVPVLRASSVVFLVRAVAGVPRVLLQRRRAFRTLALLALLRLVPAAAAAIAAAAAGWGVWSLVLYLVVGEAVEAAGAAAAARWRPRGRVSLGALRPFVAFGGAATLGEAAGYVLYQSPAFVVGRLLGAAPLGVFRVGYALAMKPASLVQDLARGVVFPVLARRQDAPERLRSAYLRALRLATLAAVVAGAALAVPAREVVGVLYGAAWADVVPVLWWLGPAVVPFALHALAASVFYALGRPDLELRANLVALAPFLAALPLVVPFGADAAAAALALGVGGAVVLGQRRLARLLALRPADLAAAIAPALLVGAAFAAVLAASLAGLAALGAGPLVRLVVAGACAGVVAAAAVRRWLPETAADVRALVPLRISAAARRALPGALARVRRAVAA